VTAALDGVTVVVTRPAAQAGPWLERVRALGANGIACPTLQIDWLVPDAAMVQRLRAQPWDWAIFTSTNAVAAAAAQLGLPLAARHAAVGHATAEALRRQGITVAAQPAAANSEGLLGLPQFSGVAGQAILLLKGEGGRELLRDTLIERGAQVLPLAVYRRSALAPTRAAIAGLAAALDNGSRVVVAVTSVEILEALLRGCPADLAPALRRSNLLVPGPRVQAAALAAGWTGPIVAAATAEDDAMLTALQRHIEGALPGTC
jgi:uroporphyrinogen-III synthase